MSGISHQSEVGQYAAADRETDGGVSRGRGKRGVPAAVTTATVTQRPTAGAGPTAVRSN